MHACLEKGKKKVLERSFVILRSRRSYWSKDSTLPPCRVVFTDNTAIWTKTEGTCWKKSSILRNGSLPTLTNLRSTSYFQFICKIIECMFYWSEQENLCLFILPALSLKRDLSKRTMVCIKDSDSFPVLVLLEFTVFLQYPCPPVHGMSLSSSVHTLSESDCYSVFRQPVSGAYHLVFTIR